MLSSALNHAEVAELADAQASGVCGATRESSNLSFRTNKEATSTDVAFVLSGELFHRPGPEFSLFSGEVPGCAQNFCQMAHPPASPPPSPGETSAPAQASEVADLSTHAPEVADLADVAASALRSDPAPAPPPAAPEVPDPDADLQGLAARCLQVAFSLPPTAVFDPGAAPGPASASRYTGAVPPALSTLRAQLQQRASFHAQASFTPQPATRVLVSAALGVDPFKPDPPRVGAL